MAKLSAKGSSKNRLSAKKPSTRSKTGNAACSEAASNWQLSLRGKAALSPDTYQTLAKCRAQSKAAKQAEGYGRTGKLSAQGEAAVKGRLQQRFDRGLITQKARTERLGMLLKQRADRGKVVAPVQPPASPIAAAASPFSRGGKLAPGRGTEERKRTAQYLLETRKQVAKKTKLIDRNRKRPNRTASDALSLSRNMQERNRFSWNLGRMRQHAQKLTAEANQLAR